MHQQAKRIAELKQINLSDREIASLLELARSTVAVYRSRFKIKANRKRGGQLKDKSKFKRIVCSLLNKEHPQMPLSDEVIVWNLNKIGIKVSRWQVLMVRYELGIPPSRSIPKTALNRRMLYFQKGRYVWKIDGKHRKNK